jgi:hypothetical protein
VNFVPGLASGFGAHDTAILNLGPPWAEKTGNVITEQEINKRLQELVAEYVNRGYRPRDAVERALKALSDWAVSEGMSAQVRIGVAEFEGLVKMVEAQIERFRVEQERGAVPVGGGVYVDVVESDEFAERVGREGRK